MIQHKLTDRVDVDVLCGCVRLVVGDLPEPFVVMMSSTFAEALSHKLQAAVGEAELMNELHAAKQFGETDTKSVAREEK